MYADDPVDVLFAQIEGSAKAVLDDGSVEWLEFAGKNGRAYRGVGGVLRGSGLLAPGQGTMQGIRAWLAAHPDRFHEIVDQDASYVFFMKSKQPGAVGSQQVILTAERSGLDVRGHTLVWGQPSGNGMPPWLKETLNPADFTAAVLDGIDTQVTRYRGRVQRWDVVNEPFEALSGELQKNAFFERMGPDYIEQALRAARAADERGLGRAAKVGGRNEPGARGGHWRACRRRCVGGRREGALEARGLLGPFRVDAHFVAGLLLARTATGGEAAADQPAQEQAEEEGGGIGEHGGLLRTARQRRGTGCAPRSRPGRRCRR